jgi:hypothetical protein
MYYSAHEQDLLDLITEWYCPKIVEKYQFLDVCDDSKIEKYARN